MHLSLQMNALNSINGADVLLILQYCGYWVDGGHLNVSFFLNVFIETGAMHRFW